MSKINLEDLKSLSKETSAGLVHCKQALSEAHGDLTRAREILKELGHAVSVKKANRGARDGVVGALSSGKFGVILELNCETDFVARNEKFQQFAQSVLEAACAAKVKSVEECLSTPLPGGQKVRDAIVEQVAVFRENIVLSRCVTYEVSQSGLLGVYVHNKYTENLGKIGVAVAVVSEADPSFLSTVAKDIAIQVMSECPCAIDVARIPPNLLESEKHKYNLEVEGKPASVAEKIIAGKLSKFYKKVVLLEQPLFSDPERSVKQYISDKEMESSAKIDVVWYEVFVLGEAS
ncbi:translation elongation factor Ts [Neorickettsia sennetsu]|uniref:Elongation factor Ts n=1 Tax=Ehrlichia sennetsu (strain ATCC VR-367 / Miyayama) TaxID=222891 RepID=EFTS_EHRS3|nr:translation elongation factor Ts [Neorickettsia sennetsu]Q2GCI5.1 RecName: Full=Elongation factor Ts; Short=EF-Ts [Neorickettsia sennetsu str. Miyayama]ABD46009.1 translation elongation factor Ts [Neorickettsia sennetsu str. Miyayama]